MALAVLLKCTLGPRLHRIHGSLRFRPHGEANDSHEHFSGHYYEANSLENGASSVIRWLRVLKAVCQWTSPVILTFLYRRDYHTAAGIVSLSKMIGGLLLVYIVAVFLRGIGRALNPTYVEFIRVLEAAKKDYSPENKAALHKYDSDIFPWPNDYEFGGHRVERKEYSFKPHRPPHGFIDKITSIPSAILGYFAIHTFGRRMVYPGATCIQALFHPTLVKQRASMIEERNGKRAKLLAADGNTIDTMFIDRRDTEQDGKHLMICSEGNAGFYEIGCMVTPLDTGHSVLGWNHPGFGNSTGIPFPSQEQNAIDVVIQYAIEELGFQLSDITLFSWSIGGYASTWAAMSYPDIHSVILDATFDDLIPLAIHKMPRSLEGLVTMTLRKYMNLNNAEQLCKYPGPVLLIRRTKDEMITTMDGVLASNRGNDLLRKLLQHRYPNIMNEESTAVLQHWLAVDRGEQGVMLSEYEVENRLLEDMLHTYIEEHSPTYPLLIGDRLTQLNKNQLVLFLASRYMDNFDAPHGQPLPGIFMRDPWSESKMRRGGGDQESTTEEEGDPPDANL